MTKFEKKIAGKLGTYWEKDAKKTTERVRQQILKSEIRIISKVPYNKADRVVTNEIQEILNYLDIKFDNEKTTQAREAETLAVIENYRHCRKEISEEEKYELRCAFGNEKVTNLF